MSVCARSLALEREVQSLNRTVATLRDRDEQQSGMIEQLLSSASRIDSVGSGSSTPTRATPGLSFGTGIQSVSPYVDPRCLRCTPPQVPCCAAVAEAFM